jgi:hypothetical protein
MSEAAFGGRGTSLAPSETRLHGLFVRHHVQGETLGQNVLADAVAHEADADEANVLDCHGDSLSAMK